MADASQKLQALVRSLNLIPYFKNHPDKTPMEAATDLGMEPGELKEALDRLFCSGTGRNTEDLIDLSFSYRDGVTIHNDQGLSQALRLTPTEAGALLLTLESLQAMPGLIDAQAVESAAAKLRGIMDEKTAAIYDSLSTPAPEETDIQALLTQAVNERKRVRLRYWSASSNAESERLVDPARIFIVDSEPYLAAWEEAKQAHRTFRIDRIRTAHMEEEQSQPHLKDLDFDAVSPFNLGDGDTVQLAINQEFTWLAEYYDMRLGEDLGNGEVAATMPMGSVDWLIRFALGQADRLRVVAPQSVVNLIAERGNTALSGYTQ